MFRISIKPMFWLGICIFSLAACSGGELTAEPQAQETAREFSQADKNAARVLSISNTEIMASAETPYAQALLCRHGVAEITAVISETSGLSTEQEQGLRQAEALFDQKLRDLAGAGGKSAEDIRGDLEQTAQDNNDQATNVRIAIGCLEQLQQG